MDNQILIALIGLSSAIVGGLIASIPNFIQQHKEHKRWLIEKRIEYLKEQINKIEANKKHVLKDLRDILYGDKLQARDNNFISSVPMEVIDAFKKHLPDGATYISSLSKDKKDKVFIDAASAIENKINELGKNIKKLLT